MNKKLMGVISIIALVAFLLLPDSLVAAENAKSSSYELIESAINNNNSLESSSQSYMSSSATGDLVVGETNSDGYIIDTGSQTTNDPTLSFSINSNGVLGNFTATEATMTTATFSVMNYTSFGYIVQIIGSPPTYNGHVISAMSETGESQSGIEQFGINLVANTLPKSVGANPDNGQFGFGEAANNYDTANSYRYVSGETIAQAPKSSGITVYTISYLVNVSSLTPGGQYSSEQALIITGTY